MALTRDTLVDKLVAEHGLQRREAVDFLDTFFDDIKKVVEDGGRVKLAGFGSFALNKQYYQRKKRDAPLDEDTPHWRTVTFTPAVKLKGRIQRATVELARDVD